jgi:hypothetical protein
MLEVFKKGSLSPLPEVGGGMLVILHIDETPEDFQYVSAKVLGVDCEPESRRQKISGRVIVLLEARVTIIELLEEKRCADPTDMSLTPFEPLCGRSLMTLVCS